MDSERKYSPDVQFENKENPGIHDSQRVAIIYSILRGREIQQSFPEVAEDYRQGLSLRQIVEKHNIDSKFNLKKQTAFLAVHRALWGFKGEMKITNQPPYPGLITNKEELSAIGEDHSRKHGEQIGKRMKAEGGGFFAFSKKEQKEVGKKSGKANFIAKVGIHAQTPQERTALGLLALKARGVTPLSDEENILLKELLSSSEYRKGKVTDIEKITQTLNNKFHNGNPIRKPENLKAIIYRKRKEWAKPK